MQPPRVPTRKIPPPDAGKRSLDAQSSEYERFRRLGVPRELIGDFMDLPPSALHGIRSRIQRFKAKHPLRPEEARGCQRAGELFQLWHPVLSATCIRAVDTGIKLAHMALDLAAKLTAALQRRTQLLLDESKRETELRELLAAASLAEARATEEKEIAYLADREPDSSVVRSAAVATKKASEAEERLRIARGALTRHVDAIEVIRGEIESTRYERYVTSSEAKRKRVLNAVSELVDACQDLAAEAGGQGIQEHQFFEALARYERDSAGNDNSVFRGALFALIRLARRSVEALGRKAA